MFLLTNVNISATALGQLSGFVGQGHLHDTGGLPGRSGHPDCVAGDELAPDRRCAEVNLSNGFGN